MEKMRTWNAYWVNKKGETIHSRYESTWKKGVELALLKNQRGNIDKIIDISLGHRTKKDDRLLKEKYGGRRW